MSEPRNATIAYPGGLRARWRWGGSGSAAQVFALTEAGGSLVDFGSIVSADPDALWWARHNMARFDSFVSPPHSHGTMW